MFDDLVTLRISFQKALVASFKLHTPLPSDAVGETCERRGSVLKSLGELNEKLFHLRDALRVPGVEMPVHVGKRKRVEGDEAMDESYWVQAAKMSLDLVDVYVFSYHEPAPGSQVQELIPISYKSYISGQARFKLHLCKSARSRLVAANFFNRLKAV